MASFTAVGDALVGSESSMVISLILRSTVLISYSAGYAHRVEHGCDACNHMD